MSDEGFFEKFGKGVFLTPVAAMIIAWSMCVWAFIGWKAWGWFVPHIDEGLPMLTFTQMLCVNAVLSTLRGHRIKPTMDQYFEELHKAEDVWKTAALKTMGGHMFILPAMLLAILWILHLILGTP